MSENVEEQEKAPHIIRVREKDRGVTKFTFNPDMEEKIVIILEDASSDVSE